VVFQVVERGGGQRYIEAAVRERERDAIEPNVGEAPRKGVPDDPPHALTAQVEGALVAVGQNEAGRPPGSVQATEQVDRDIAPARPYVQESHRSRTSSDEETAHLTSDQSAATQISIHAPERHQGIRELPPVAIRLIHELRQPVRRASPRGCGGSGSRVDRVVGLHEFPVRVEVQATPTLTGVGAHSQPSGLDPLPAECLDATGKPVMSRECYPTHAPLAPMGCETGRAVSVEAPTYENGRRRVEKYG
jgi:hypothetical protein